jgi:hypothetical protein
VKVQLEPARVGEVRDVRTACRAGSSVDVSGFRSGVNWSSGYITVEDEEAATTLLGEFTSGLRKEVAFCLNSLALERGDGAGLDSGQERVYPARSDFGKTLKLREQMAECILKK